MHTNAPPEHIAISHPGPFIFLDGYVIFLPRQNLVFPFTQTVCYHFDPVANWSFELVDATAPAINDFTVRSPVAGQLKVDFNGTDDSGGAVFCSASLY